jgi:hypothetical protein
LRGYGIARVGAHAKALGGSGSETSAAQLLALCDAALAGKPAPKAAAPAAPPAPEPEPSEPEVSEDESEDEGEEKPYEDWLKADLVAEAESRGLETKDQLKADLVEALYADDE